MAVAYKEKDEEERGDDVKNVTRLYLRVHRLYRSIASIHCNKLTKRRPAYPRISLDFVTFVTFPIIYEINSLQLSAVKHGYRALIIYKASN